MLEDDMSKRDTEAGMAGQASLVHGTRQGRDPHAPDRHVYGPRPVGALVPVIARPAFRKRAPAAAQVMADWADIVGPRLAALTAPRRLSAGRLTIACSGPVAMELQHLAPQLIARINTHLGSAVIERLGFVQAVDAAEPSRVAVRETRPLTPADERRAEEAVAGLPQGDLRDALAALSRSVLTAEPVRGRRRAKASTLPSPKQ